MRALGEAGHAHALHRRVSVSWRSQGGLGPNDTCRKKVWLIVGEPEARTGKEFSALHRPRADRQDKAPCGEPRRSNALRIGMSWRAA